MARHIGTVHLHSLGSAALATTHVSVTYATPNVQSLRVVHNVDATPIRGVTGKVTGVIGNDDSLECTFEMIPENSIANGVDGPLVSAALPKIPSAFTISGLQVIECGGIANALNGLWVYLGGGVINAFSDNFWTMSLPLRRFQGITSATVVTG